MEKEFLKFEGHLGVHDWWYCMKKKNLWQINIQWMFEPVGFYCLRFYNKKLLTHCLFVFSYTMYLFPILSLNNNSTLYEKLFALRFNFLWRYSNSKEHIKFFVGHNTKISIKNAFYQLKTYFILWRQVFLLEPKTNTKYPATAVRLFNKSWFLHKHYIFLLTYLTIVIDKTFASFCKTWHIFDFRDFTIIWTVLSPWRP